MMLLQWVASSDDDLIGSRTWSCLILLAVHSIVICLKYWNPRQVVLPQVLQNDLNVCQSKKQNGKNVAANL